MSFTVYKASAGSGKTYTLVKEFLKVSLSSDNENYKNILAITFTNKAAAEMKQRVVSSLSSLASKKEPSGTVKFLLADLVLETGLNKEQIQEKCSKILTSVLHRYSDLGICTIDKFTHKIIREFAHDLHLPVNFEVEMDKNALINRAVDMLLAKTGLDPELTNVLLEFSLRKIEEEKRWHIENDIADLASGIFDDESVQFLSTLKNIEIKDLIKVRDVLKSKIKGFESHLASKGQEALSLIASAGIDHNQFAFGAKSGIAKYFIYLIEKRNYKPSPRIVSSIENDKWYASKISISEKAAIDSIKAELSAIFSYAVTYVSENFQEYSKFCLINQNIYGLMLLTEVEKMLGQLKKEQNKIHISEFNKYISSIVVNEPAPFIYERIGEKYKHYLIDEFQDTSVLQWQNLLPLLDNSLSTGNFNLIVGDGKQSIYRWRGGEVEQFASLPKLFRADPENLIMEQRGATLERNYQPKVLKNNFRSKKEVVDFNNQFFSFASTLLTEEYANIYNELEQNYSESNSGGYIQIDIIESESDEDYREYNCKKILQTIQGALIEGYAYKDMAILFRTNEKAAHVAEFLLQNNIEVISPDSLLICNSSKVSLIILLLKHLFAPSDKSTLCLIVKSLIQNEIIKGEEITDVLSSINIEGKEIFDKLLKKHNIHLNTESLCRLPLFEACENLIRIFRFNNPADPYVLFLSETVQQYSTSGNDTSINSFLEWWENNKTKKSVIIPPGTDAVNIMTIHKSKGLEFPLVIFPFADWREDKNKNTWWIDVDNEDLHPLSSALIPLNQTLLETEHSSIYETEKNKSRLDNLNLLYVAMTRPEERLYIFTSPKENNVSDYFRKFLDHNQLWKDDIKQYVFGAKTNRKPSDSNENKEALIINSVISTDWDNKISISRQAEKFWNLEAQENAASFGSLIHQALSEIKTMEDVPAVLDKLQISGTVSPDERSGLTEKLNRLLLNPLLNPFFTVGNTIKNESEIILPSGKTYRPDRVVITSDKTVIIDYKTGSPLPSHKEQMLKYASVLEDMGYKNLEKLLVYIMDEKIVKV
jgi:ATP-dependent exoDNAse (exonuclease V) beta subunit